MNKEVSFPELIELNINMMPIIMGNLDSIPNYAKQYEDMIEKCDFEKGTTVYLTVNESVVQKGKTQRRPGIHTDGTNKAGWGGGGWGNKEGIYMASTDGRCKMWNCQTHDADHLGEVSEPITSGEIMKPNILYWMTDRTPHESLPALKTSMRQFFRLVSEDIGIWYAQHSTPNPLGIQPNCPVSLSNKFAT